ncbi:MAG: hypothetical protein JOZ51_15225 [Chloroflexi bacterium]|nr:hypothetical protein [Chloroflexota bacterium]
MDLTDHNAIFAASGATSVITSRGVLRDGKPILFADRMIEDGSWILLDADLIDAEDELAATLDEIMRHDPAVGELADLPLGWQARRQSSDAPWIRYPRCC